MNLDALYNVVGVMNDLPLLLILLKYPDLTISEAERMLAESQADSVAIAA